MTTPETRTPGGSGQANAKTKISKQPNSRPAGGYKSIPSSWWLTADFLGLNALEQRLLTMLWTAPTTPLCGIVELAPEHWASRLQASPRAVRSALGGLHNAGFVDIEHGEPMVCLIGHIEAQLRGHPKQSAAWVANTCNAIDRLPEGAVVSRFRERYGLPKKGQGLRGSRGGSGGGSPRGALNPNRKERGTASESVTVLRAREVGRA